MADKDPIEVLTQAIKEQRPFIFIAEVARSGASTLAPIEFCAHLGISSKP